MVGHRDQPGCVVTTPDDVQPRPGSDEWHIQQGHAGLGGSRGCFACQAELPPIPDLPGPVAATPDSPDDCCVRKYIQTGSSSCPLLTSLVAPYGPPSQVAAARPAILRELADQLDAKADAVSTNPRYRPRLYLDAPRLRQLADEIEAGAGGQQPEGGGT
jgi:hypothetical protein